jgi:hypothetical protein
VPKARGLSQLPRSNPSAPWRRGRRSSSRP